jgi:hypothetical protein
VQVVDRVIEVEKRVRVVERVEVPAQPRRDEWAGLLLEPSSRSTPAESTTVTYPKSPSPWRRSSVRSHAEIPAARDGCSAPPVLRRAV